MIDSTINMNKFAPMEPVVIRQDDLLIYGKVVGLATIAQCELVAVEIDKVKSKLFEELEFPVVVVPADFITTTADNIIYHNFQ